MKSITVIVLSSELASAFANNCSCVDSPLRRVNEGMCIYNQTLPGVFGTDKVCYPLDYGSDQCEAHDIHVINTTCNTADVFDPTLSWCRYKWCYVDLEQCKRTPSIVIKSDLFPEVNGLFFSYSPCQSDSVPIPSLGDSKAIVDKTLKVTFPFFMFPYHYKKNGTKLLGNENIEAYHDDSMPWMGSDVDYLEEIKKESNVGLNFRYTSVSRGAERMFPRNREDAAVFDVATGVSDLAGGSQSYWIRSDSLELTAFSVPFDRSEFYLWIEQPKFDNGFYANMERVFQPFDPLLWVILLLLIILVGWITAWFSTAGGVSSVWDELQERFHHAPFPMRALLFIGRSFDAFVIQAQSLFGGGVDLDYEAATSQRILGFGYSFMVLIVMATYTANLAAFLGQSRVLDYISTMEEFIAKNAKICAFDSLRVELETLYPEANFLFSKTRKGVVQNYINGMCPGIIADYVRIKENRNDVQNIVCELNIVRTETLVLTLPLAMPVREEYASDISYWMGELYNMEKTPRSFRKIPQKKCNLVLSKVKESSERNPMKPLNLLGPIFFLTFCVMLAVVVHFLQKYRRKKISERKMEKNNCFSNTASDNSTNDNENTHLPESSIFSLVAENKDATNVKSKNEVMIPLQTCLSDILEVISDVRQL